VKAGGAEDVKAGGKLRIQLVLFSVAIQSSVALAQSPGTFSTAGVMINDRFHHTATLLPNGKVLIAGGVHSMPTIPIDKWFGIYASAEIYDPPTGRFTPTGDMTAHRAGHTATLLPNGKVLIAGGELWSFSAELYDPATGTFTGTGDMTQIRAGHMATLLNNGTVLISGGGGDGREESYDPSTGTFTAIGDTAKYRGGTVAALLGNGTVLIDGGAGSADTNTAEIFDPAAASFAPGGSEIHASEEAPVTATLLPNGKVFEVLGPSCEDCDSQDAEVYDPSTRTFTATGRSAAFRALVPGNNTATLLPDGTVMTISGTAELFDPLGRTFFGTGSLRWYRYGHTATLLPDGTVLIAGGQASSGNPGAGSFAEIYHPSVLISPPALLKAPDSGQGAILHGATQQLVSADNPAVAGEVVEIYLTGLTDRSAIPPQVIIGGRMAQVLFFGGAPGYSGLSQVDVRVPDGVAAGPAASVRLFYLGRPSNEVTIAVQ
jgi:hypothetical protein